MRKQSAGEIFIGITILIIGVGLFADALGVVRFGELVRMWWPLVLVAGGLLALLSKPRSWWWPVILIVAGILLLLGTLGVTQFNTGKLVWPTILILAGLGILLERGKRPLNSDKEAINSFVLLSGSEERSVAQHFKGGELTAILGGTVLDLNDAQLSKEGATLNIFAFCGGIEIKVPEGWVVQVEGLPIMGGWENNTRTPKTIEGVPRLVIRATCIMGGFSVKNGH